MVLRGICLSFFHLQTHGHRSLDASCGTFMHFPKLHTLPFPPSPTLLHMFFLLPRMSIHLSKLFLCFFFLTLASRIQCDNNQNILVTWLTLYFAISLSRSGTMFYLLDSYRTWQNAITEQAINKCLLMGCILDHAIWLCQGYRTQFSKHVSPFSVPCSLFSNPLCFCLLTSQREMMMPPEWWYNDCLHEMH